MTFRHVLLAAAEAALLVGSLQAQPKAVKITGQIALVRTTDLSAVAKGTASAPKKTTTAIAEAAAVSDDEPQAGFENHRALPQRFDAAAASLFADLSAGKAGVKAATRGTPSASSFLAAADQALGISNTFSGSGFSGVTHKDQKDAYNVNQFSIEPPSPSIAVGGSYVLEGVNNAVQVFSASGGAPLLARAVSTNELFGLSPACMNNPLTGRCVAPFGPYLTDMRVFYDWSIDRWFVVQRSLDNDAAGNTLSSSHLYIAVSQTNDPTGVYNIYAMDTSNAGNGFFCPCFSDYPALGADQYGFYISSNEYSIAYSQYVDVAILGISKKALAAGSAAPSAYRILARQATGYEFTIFPATTPPGASYFVGENGLEYFVSSILGGGAGSKLTVWALRNTKSVDTDDPQPQLSWNTVDTLSYINPDRVPQRPGPLPFGATLVPPGQLAYIDAGDSRIQSVTYSGGRLFAALATQTTDDFANQVAGGAYFVFSPVFRNGSLQSAFILNQGYVKVNKNHLLTPSIAANAKGQAAIAFTLVGTDYYPSAGIVRLSNTMTSQGIVYSLAPTLEIAGPGSAPEDGFTGYPNVGFVRTGIARWGDYSTAVAAPDGSIWAVTEYIPNAPRSLAANWGTYVMRVPGN